MIVRIREFDSVSQRGLRDLSFVKLGSAAVLALAMNAEIADALKAKSQLVIAGSDHDLRFIKKRLPKKNAAGAKPVARWVDAEQGWLNRVKLLDMRLSQGWRDQRRLVISASDVFGAKAGLAAWRRRLTQRNAQRQQRTAYWPSRASSRSILSRTTSTRSFVTWKNWCGAVSANRSA